MLKRKLIAELVGTFWLVFAGCGSIVVATDLSAPGIGLVGISMAFGLSMMTMVSALGHISGGHFNPAVTLGYWAGGRLPAVELVPYMLSQVLGAVLAAGLLWLIVGEAPGFDASAGFAANGYGSHSPGGYSASAAFTTEFFLTLFFVFTVLSVTERTAVPQVAAIAIGLAFTVVHLVGIPVTQASVNPARSTGPALFAGAWAIGQLWLFWIAPLAGGVVASALHHALAEGE